MLENVLENLYSCSIGPSRFRGTDTSIPVMHSRTLGGTLGFHYEFYLQMFYQAPNPKFGCHFFNLITWSSYARMTMLLRKILMLRMKWDDITRGGLSARTWDASVNMTCFNTGICGPLLFSVLPVLTLWPVVSFRITLTAVQDGLTFLEIPASTTTNQRNQSIDRKNIVKDRNANSVLLECTVAIL